MIDYRRGTLKVMSGTMIRLVFVMTMQTIGQAAAMPLERCRHCSVHWKHNVPG